MICCGPEEKKRIVAENGGRSDDSSWLPTAFGGSKVRHAPDSKIPKRWDVVLVYTGSVALTEEEQKLDVLERQKRESELNELAIRRKEAFAGLAAVGFKTHSFTEEAEEGKVPKSYTLISVPESLLRETAEAIGLEKRLKPGPYDPPEYTAYDEYTMLKHDMFLKDPYAEDAFFTSLERLQCVFHLIEAPEYERPRCAAIDLDKLVADKVFEAYFCMDDKARLEELKEKWVYGSTLRKLPINLIRDYLGEKIALYFAWVHMYTAWLGTLGVLSLVPFIYSLYWKDSPTDTPYDNWAMPVYGLLSMIWAQLFLEAWKREQAMYAFIWNTGDFEDEEALRPEYRKYVLEQKREWESRNPAKNVTRELHEDFFDPKKGDTKKGRWSKAGFVPVSDNEDKLLLENTREVEWFNPRIQRWRRVITTVIGIILVAIIAFVTVLLQGMKTYIAMQGSVYKDFSQYIAALMQSMFIVLMTFIWSKVGTAINDWEMHRTDTEWEDSLMLKTFGFQFINSYGPAFYIAFVQGYLKVPLLHIDDPNNPGHQIPLEDHCLDDKCYKAIYLQMLIIILSKQVSRNLLALAPPIYAKMKSLMCTPTAAEEKIGLHRTVMRQAQLAQFPGTHMEYIEMAIQFGYVAIFAVAFPVGSIVCWINNLLEKRADAVKIAVLMQRPRYLGTHDIGSMQSILEFIALISVFVNCGILCLSSEAYYAYFPQRFGDRPSWQVFAFTVVMEHLILMMKSIVAALVPDTPLWVEVEKTKVEMRKEAYRLAHLSAEQIARREQMQKKRQETEWKQSNDADIEDGDLF